MSAGPTCPTWQRDLGGGRARLNRDVFDPVRRRANIEKTPALLALINVNSPLRYDDRMLGALMTYAEANQARNRHAIPDGRGNVAMASPARSRSRRQKLWRGSR